MTCFDCSKFGFQGSFGIPTQLVDSFHGNLLEPHALALSATEEQDSEIAPLKNMYQVPGILYPSETINIVVVYGYSW